MTGYETGILKSLSHSMIKRLIESRKVSACKGQVQKPILNASSSWCIVICKVQKCSLSTLIWEGRTQSGKMCKIWSDKSKFWISFWKPWMSHPRATKKKGRSSPARTCDGMEVLQCPLYGKLAHLSHYSCWKVQRDFGIKYRPNSARITTVWLFSQGV